MAENQDSEKIPRHARKQPGYVPESIPEAVESQIESVLQRRSAESADALAAIPEVAPKPVVDKDAAEVPQPSQDEKPKKKRSIWSIIFIVALIVFLVSAGALALIGLSYCQGQQKYKDIALEAGLEEAAVEAGDLEALSIDWDALRAVNPEVVAWVYVPGTPISYPVVQAADNDKYLTVDFDGDSGWLANYGAIFLDYRNNPDFTDRANFIYGHHMNDGSMFAELAHFPDQARFDECRTVYLLTPAENYKLRTFSLLHVEATDPIVQTEFADDAAYQAYIQDIMDRSVVAVNDAPTADKIGRVFALATCDDYGEGRYVLFSYIEDESATGLSGTLGVIEEDGQAVGLDEELVETEGEQAAGDSSAETAESEDGE